MTKKRVDMTVTVHLPDGHDADRVQLSSDGRFVITDKAGNQLAPTRIERATHYARAKGVKYQARSVIDDSCVSVGGVEELSRFDQILAIDTNSVDIEGRKVSAACLIACRVVKREDGFHLVSIDGCHYVYEFHDVPGNPEMLAILKIARDIIKAYGKNIPENFRVAFITDSELDSHAAMSRREVPLYQNHFLPEGFTLIYASGDTGQEVANTLIRTCDNASTKYLNQLRDGAFRLTGLAPVEEDNNVVFRCTSYPGLKVLESLVEGSKITSSTTYTVKFEN
jgi:hypothetical protein